MANAVVEMTIPKPAQSPPIWAVLGSQFFWCRSAEILDHVGWTGLDWTGCQHGLDMDQSPTGKTSRCTRQQGKRQYGQ